MASIPQPVEQRQHIETAPQRCGGRPCIVGSRVRVQDIVLRSEQGQTPDQIVDDLMHLSLADVHAALAYYYDHRQLIDQHIADDLRDFRTAATDGRDRPRES